MQAIDYLKYIVDEIHSTVFATVDQEGRPVTCAIDMMDCDENGLYFLTAKGKSFYRRLKQNAYVAFTAMKGEDTLSCVAVSVRGKIRELGEAPLPRLLQKNPYMKEIYPTAESQKALTVFQLFEGTGEWFDLSQKPIQRFSFSIGQRKSEKEGFRITDACTGCRACEEVCPQNCIDFGFLPAVIQQEHCLHCGNCQQVCPQNAVIREGAR